MSNGQHLPRGRFGVKFTHDVTLGSMVVIAISLLMTIQVYFFWSTLTVQIAEARDYQKINRSSIERLNADMRAYSEWAADTSVQLAQQIEILRADVQRLKEDVRALRDRVK